MERRSLRDQWRRLIGRDAARDIDDELAFHVEMRARELEAAGETPERARERALARFGSVSEARDRCMTIAERRERKVARSEYLDELRQDLRFAVRTLVRTPAFTVIALATLVLGIGANTAIFSVVNGVLLRPLPFPEPEEVVHLGWDWGGGTPSSSVSAYKLEYFGERAESFEAVATYRGFSAGLGEEEMGAEVRGLRVTPGFLDVVGHPLALGRWFGPEESVPGGPAVAVIGHGLWQELGGGRDVIGRQVPVGGEAKTVIGVLAEGFRFPQAASFTDLLVPFQLQVDVGDQGHNYPVLARLAEGVDEERANAELATLSARFRADHPDLMSGERERGLRVTSYQVIHVGSLGPVLWTLMAAVGLVLLIACANVANLLLARTSERQGEMAVRSAVGATRGRLVRQLLTESVVLSMAAGALGLGVAAWATRALVASMPSELPRSGEIGVDGRVIAFTVGASLITALVFGLAAALPSSRRGPMGALREGGRGAVGGGGLRSALVTAEAAVSMVLLVGAGLLVSTLLELGSVDAGFEPEGLVTASVPRWPARYDDAATLAAFEARLLDRLESATRPGGPIEAVALAPNVPLERGWNLPMEIEGRPETVTGDVEWRAVSPGYFEAVGSSIVRGRGFTEADGRGGRRVVIVNEAFAREYFPDGGALGQRVAIGRYQGKWIGPQYEAEPAEIIGIVEDMREMALRREPKRTMIVPREHAAMAMPPVILVRTSRPGEAAGLIRAAIQDVDASLPVPQIRPMREVIGESLARDRFNALLMSMFAGLALLLTAAGIFGVVSYGVRRRRAEIGIRMALGARATDVVRLVTRQGMMPVVAGLALGVVASLLLGRFLRSMVWGVSVADPRTFAVVIVVLAGVALTAAWIPARRAAAADPVRSLRQS